MRYTIMSLFRDIESDAVYTSFDRNAGDVGYTFDEAVAIVTKRGWDAAHNDAVIEFTGGKGNDGIGYFQVKVRDDTSMQKWSVIGP